MSERIRKNKRLKWRSIEGHPAIVDEGTEIGHLEADTVVGPRKGRGAAVFTAVEKVTHNYIAIRISGRTCADIEEAIIHLKSEYGEARFSQVPLTTGQSSRRSRSLRALARRYTSPTPTAHGNARRTSVTTASSVNISPKEQTLTDTVTRHLNIADEINSRPRRVLGYQTPAEQFNTFLDEVHTIENTS